MKHLEEMISHIFILLFVIRGSYSAVGSSPNSKLRKNYRNTIEIFEKLLNTPVSKEEHQEAIAAATANRIGIDTDFGLVHDKNWKIIFKFVVTMTRTWCENLALASNLFL